MDMYKSVIVKNWEIQICAKHGVYFRGLAGIIIGKRCSSSFIKYNSDEKNELIAYDYPERIPAYVKNKLRIELNRLAYLYQGKEGKE